MCLSRVDFHTKHIKTGYKVLEKKQYEDMLGQVHDTYYTPYQGSTCQLDAGSWYDEKEYRPYKLRVSSLPLKLVTERGSASYLCGFHIFVTRKGAETWIGTANAGHLVVAKVSVKDCVASGTQLIRKNWHNIGFYRVVVAKQIKIEKEVAA